MVPGHIDAQEIGSIARLITSLNPELPYSLLAFHPEFNDVARKSDICF